ncbi:MAG: LysM peptidoglycan-binding domain-containing protein [Ardenticatenaceae bacterium]|nr:LysM peptidoglycan-binding domain-containing protein [Ardenticatenaceae bacterium]HBY98458.1 hypothetical protein [Chloroflexota bacterium]
MCRARAFSIALLVALCLLAALATPISAEGNIHVVQRGDTLISIAQHYGVSLDALAAANGLRSNSWVYVGQRLVIPSGGNAASPPAAVPAPAAGGEHVVQQGDTLTGIAQRYSTTVAALMQANGLRAANIIYVGQRLTISGSGASGLLVDPAGLSGEKWIDVNLSTQRLTAYVGQTPVFATAVSTGIWKYPTVAGTYRVYVKYRSTTMTGGSGADYYYLPNVPYVMYFFRGYGLHGTYWHNNFGRPMSHGCVNLSVPDAKWLYGWAEVGTRVVTHY